MGASQSKTDVTPKIIPNQTPVQFSQDVVDYLSDRLESPETTPERQISLDNRVRSRIQAELQALRAEEEKVQQEIHRALEKENLDRESDVGDGTPLSEAKNSATLIGNLEEIKAKVDRYQTRRQLSDFPFLKEAGEEVVSCYRSNQSTPLECWKEVARFKVAVAEAEAQYLASLR
ncbi:hypothetical protein SCLCIDRAFT_18392 [Scleroderma citrinum Foug A]|uniref:DUF1690 domain-containing protein n=1 Tax=Scleroderma citrinum Foug A TaxID=1036808 RepID=A0A0C3D4Y0_9AGAM|nr:hypothetical protein SCLCIDRAFT_18392 [Scleroderma citrinum Foug A]